MTFLQPLLLWGLPLLLIPLAIHLMNRLRYRSVRWAAMTFLLKANRHSTSMARIRQWLLLMLRALAVCALVLALARPLVGGWLGWSLSGPPDAVVVLLDRSASMGALADDGSQLLRKAVAKIAETGQRSAPDADITLIDSATLSPLHVPSWDTLPVLSAVRPTETAADASAMFAAAVDHLLRDASGKTEIWIASDMQRSNWNASSSDWETISSKLKSLKTTPKLKLLALDPGKRALNRSLTFVEARRTRTAGGARFMDVIYEVRSPPDSKETDIPILVGDDSGSRQTTIHVSPGATRLSRRVRTPDDKNAVAWGFIKLPPDSNPLDDTLFHAFGEQPEEKAVVISSDSEIAALLALAAAPTKNGCANAETIAPSEAMTADLSAAALIVLDFAPSAKLADRLENVAAKGAEVLFFPPTKIPDPGKSAWKRIETFPRSKPSTVVEWNKKDGVLADTPSGDSIPLNSLRILKRAVPRRSGNAIAVLAHHDDGAPFLTREKIGKGAFLRCSVRPSPDWSNLGDGLVLVPMERRMMAAGAARFAKVKFSECSYRNPEVPDRPAPTVLASSSDGDSPSPRLRAGVYAWDSETLVVNLPETETIPSTLTDREVAALLPGNEIRLFHDDRKNGSNMQSEIWRLLLAAVLLALTAESLMTLPRIQNAGSTAIAQPENKKE